MRRLFLLSLLVAFMTSCVTTPFISKSTMGNLEINVYAPDKSLIANAELFIDGLFIGNPTERLPVVYAKRGERTVRIECPGYRTYERKIMILGDPNHQVLNITLEKE